MLNTVLQQKQEALNATFATSFGWHLPAQFSDLDSEYAVARDAVAVVERPYLGWLRVTGADHIDLLHRITTNELRMLSPGAGQVNIFTTEVGKIVDRVFLFKFEQDIRLMTSPGMNKTLTDWIEKYVFIEDLKIEDLSNAHTVLTIAGKFSTDVLSAAFQVDLGALSSWHHICIDFGAEQMVIQRSAEFNPPAFNLVTPSKSANAVWNSLFEHGADFGIKAVGQRTLDVWGVEAGWPVYGIDFDDRVNPHEAGMLSFIDFDKGCYIGQEVIARLDTYDKVQKYLSGIVLEGETLPPPGTKVFRDEDEIGWITRALFSPMLKRNIALAYIRTKFIADAVPVQIKPNAQRISGYMQKLPFQAL